MFRVGLCCDHLTASICCCSAMLLGHNEQSTANLLRQPCVGCAECHIPAERETELQERSNAPGMIESAKLNLVRPSSTRDELNATLALAQESVMDVLEARRCMAADAPCICSHPLHFGDAT